MPLQKKVTGLTVFEGFSSSLAITDHVHKLIFLLMSTFQ